MSTGTTTTAPVRVERPREDEVNEPDLPWIVIVWNDPINLMSYVTWVFMRLFGYPREKAERHMMEVHQLGRSILWTGELERAEGYVRELIAAQLLASLEQTG